MGSQIFQNIRPCSVMSFLYKSFHLSKKNKLILLHCMNDYFGNMSDRIDLPLYNTRVEVGQREAAAA